VAKSSESVSALREPAVLTKRDVTRPLPPSIFITSRERSCRVLVVAGRHTQQFDVWLLEKGGWRRHGNIPGSPAEMHFEDGRPSWRAIAVRSIDTLGQTSDWSVTRR
jgi:hypothetical protein